MRQQPSHFFRDAKLDKDPSKNDKKQGGSNDDGTLGQVHLPGHHKLHRWQIGKGRKRGGLLKMRGPSMMMPYKRREVWTPHSPRILAHGQILLVRAAQDWSVCIATILCASFYRTEFPHLACHVPHTIRSTIHGTFTKSIDFPFITVTFNLDSHWNSAVWPICWTVPSRWLRAQRSDEGGRRSNACEIPITEGHSHCMLMGASFTIWLSDLEMSPLRSVTQRCKSVGVRSPATRHVAYWYCWKVNRAMNLTRAASSHGVDLSEPQVRDGAITVEAVPMTLMHKDSYVVTTHGDDIIAEGSMHGLDSLNRTVRNNFRTKSWGRNWPSCSHRGRFLRGWWRSPMVSTGGSQKPGTCRNAASCSALDMNDTVNSHAEVEDSLSEVGSKNFQKLLGLMMYWSLDDPTIQFEMAMVGDVSYEQADRWCNEKADAGDEPLHFFCWYTE